MHLNAPVHVPEDGHSTGISKTQLHHCELPTGIGHFFVLNGKFDSLSPPKKAQYGQSAEECLKLNIGAIMIFVELHRQKNSSH